MILSLPKSDAHAKEKKRKRARKKDGKRREAPSTEETLEILTDRLCIWQELDNALRDDSEQKRKGDEVKDWVESFCDDVVGTL